MPRPYERAALLTPLMHFGRIAGRRAKHPRCADCGAAVIRPWELPDSRSPRCQRCETMRAEERRVQAQARRSATPAACGECAGPAGDAVLHRRARHGSGARVCPACYAAPGPPLTREELELALQRERAYVAILTARVEMLEAAMRALARV